VGERLRGRFATPADFPPQDCSPYRGLYVRPFSLGVVPRSRTVLCRPVPNPNGPDSQRRLYSTLTHFSHCGRGGGAAAAQLAAADWCGAAEVVSVELPLRAPPLAALLAAPGAGPPGRDLQVSQ
jgi:hypothetical protein